MLKKNIPVLCYHNIYVGKAMSVEMFARHLETIKALGFTTISARKLYNIIVGREKHDRKYVVITFDDCHLSNWLYAIPLLAEKGMQGVFFAVTDFISTGKCRTTQSAPLMKTPSETFKSALISQDMSQFMNSAEIRSAVEDYGMEVYSHTTRHQSCFKNLKQVGFFASNSHWSTWGIYQDFNTDFPVFKRGSAYAYNGFWPEFESQKLSFRWRSDKERYQFCLNDFKQSLAKIRELNQSQLQLFCWPWGEYDRLSLQAAKEAGYQGSFTLERWPNRNGSNPYRISRIGVAKDKDHRWLRNRLFAYGSVVGTTICFKLFRKKGEMKNILYVIDVIDNPETEQQVVHAIKRMCDAGMNVHIVVPPKQAIKLQLNGVKFIECKHRQNSLLQGLQLRKIINQHNIDIFHAFQNKPNPFFCQIINRKYKMFWTNLQKKKERKTIRPWVEITMRELKNNNEDSIMFADGHHLLRLYFER